MLPGERARGRPPVRVNKAVRPVGTLGRRRTGETRSSVLQLVPFSVRRPTAASCSSWCFEPSDRIKPTAGRPGIDILTKLAPRSIAVRAHRFTPAHGAPPPSSSQSSMQAIPAPTVPGVPGLYAAQWQALWASAVRPVGWLVAGTEMSRSDLHTDPRVSGRRERPGSRLERNMKILSSCGARHTLKTAPHIPFTVAGKCDESRRPAEVGSKLLAGTGRVAFPPSAPRRLRRRGEASCRLPAASYEELVTSQPSDSLGGGAVSTGGALPLRIRM